MNKYTIIIMFVILFAFWFIKFNSNYSKKKREERTKFIKNITKNQIQL
jgi:preprotein translocase subunit YajC